MALYYELLICKAFSLVNNMLMPSQIYTANHKTASNAAHVRKGSGTEAGRKEV